MKRTTGEVSLALGAALAMVLTFAVAGPAYAAKADCGEGYFCAWEHQNYGGRIAKMQVGCSNFSSCFASNFDNVATSFFNNSGTTFCAWANTGYSGTLIVALRPGGFNANVGSALNDRASSAHKDSLTVSCG
jgi:Peptidase inhibitor family I36